MTWRERDPLVARWIDLWAASRGLRVGELAGWPLVQVGSPKRETELICPDPSGDPFATLARHVAGDPRAMLTVFGGTSAEAESAGLRVAAHDEVLMTTSLAELSVRDLPTGLILDIDADDRREVLRLVREERVIAEGTMSVADGWAVFDRVETDPGCRRQGLGRFVMTTLASRAVARGAGRGVLVASVEGQALYSALGWRAERTVVSAVGA